MDREELEQMKVIDLRDLARETFGGGTWIASARKAVLVEALSKGEVPERAYLTRGDRDRELVALFAEAMGTDPDADPKDILDAIKDITNHQGAIKESAQIDPEEVNHLQRHKDQDTLDSLVKMRQDVLLSGPRGSGKTTAALQAAHAAGLDLFTEVMYPGLERGDLLGRTRDGSYRPSIFRTAYEGGGVFLLDDIVRGTPEIAQLVASAAGSTRYAFPDRMARRHEDFCLIMTVDTYMDGTPIGGSQEIVDLFDFLILVRWDYDEEMERKLVQDERWLSLIHRVREKLRERKLHRVVSTQTAIKGDAMLQANMDREVVEDTVLWRGLPPEVKDEII